MSMGSGGTIAAAEVRHLLIPSCGSSFVPAKGWLRSGCGGSKRK